jgi:hypothetical protein
MAIIAVQEWPSYNADFRGAGITLERSMESWVPRRGEHFVIPHAITGPITRGITTTDITTAGIELVG